MSTLRDQLLKAGLVDAKRARQAEVESRQQRKEISKARKSGLTREPTAAELAAEVARQERELHAQRSRELNRARDEERARKAAVAEIRKLVRESARPHGGGDVRYHFVQGTKVKHLYVDRAQQEALGRGDLAIVGLDGAHFLVAREVADQVLDRLPEAFVFVAEPPPEPDPDDPYAAFPIPDDLEW